MDKVISKTVLQEMEFNGDIIITDPCYIEVEGDRYTLQDVRGIWNSTLYGDWSCHVWKASNYDECTGDNVIGEFCADSGLVCVAYYDDVKKRRPDIDEWVKKHNWCATVIKNFNGVVKMIAFEGEYTYQDDWEVDKPYGHKKGEKFTDTVLELFGIGNINWIGAQTGY